MNNTIGKREADLMGSALERIISAEVLESTVGEQLPLLDDMADSNKIYYGKASMLFVDMRGSTDLPEQFNIEQLVKIYRSYIRVIVQSIRYSGGVVRDFMGDGVLAAFIDGEDGKSEDKAVRAARYLTTAIDKFLNPLLDQELNYRVSCGIGIHTGNIALSKVGMRGREQQDDVESEFGIAWVGNSTNLACKYSNAVGNGTIFISSSTYVELTNVEEKKKWKQVEIAQNGRTLKGYIAKEYYLQLENEREAYPAEKDVLTSTNPLEALSVEYQKQMESLSNRIEEITRKEQDIQAKQNQLLNKELDVQKCWIENEKRELSLAEKEYKFYCQVLKSGHCKEEYVKAMKEEFWEDNLEQLFAAGIKAFHCVQDIKQDISFAMVSIYMSLEKYDKAYDYLVVQAKGCEWMSLYTVQRVAAKVNNCDRLKTAVCERLEGNDLLPHERKDFEEIRDWLLSKCSS